MRNIKISLLSLLVATLAIAGCSNEPKPNAGTVESPAKNAASSPADTQDGVTSEIEPAENLPAEAKALLSKIEKADSFIALSTLQVESEQEEGQFEAIAKAFDSKWDALTRDRAPRTLIKGFDYLDVTTAATAEDEYTFSFLFRSSADLDTDYHFAFDGYVSPGNVKRLPKEYREEGIVKFHRRLHDMPTSEWKAGEYHVVHVKAQTPQLPYNLRLLLFSPTEEVFWNPVGKPLSLGWQWAVSDTEAFIEKIKACETPEALYTLAPAGPKLPAPIASALDGKWKVFTKGMSPKPLINGLNLLNLDTKLTGEKEYTFTFLLKTTADMTTDHIFTVSGKVDPSHLQHITPAKPDVTYASWHIDLVHNPISGWRKDQHHVVQLKIETEPIPYDVSVWLSPKGADGKWEWTKPGNRIDLGWQADIRE